MAAIDQSALSTDEAIAFISELIRLERELRELGRRLDFLEVDMRKVFRQFVSERLQSD